jgi:putative peptidoglycan lipid II flippase
MSATSQLDAQSCERVEAAGIESRLVKSMIVVAGGTLASRLTGLLRDMATASLLGLSSGALDALIVAFRIPNLFRALFGEGALSTCYVPYLAKQRSRSPAAAWQTASAVCFWLSIVLSGLVVLGEAICALLWWNADSHSTQHLLELSALLLPYLVPVCLAAQVGATLQTFSRFTWPALAPNLLNIVWLLAAWSVAPQISKDSHVQTYVLATAILLSGVLQLVVQWPALRQLGFRFQLTREASRETLAAILPTMCPTMFALAVTRINTLCDSLIAWGLAAQDANARIGWLGGIRYPLEQGAAGAIYCAERLCHFPVGLLGVTIATVVFPRFSQHAATGDRRALTEDLLGGLRWVLLLAIPASAGLWLLAEPLTALLFMRGEFTAQDAWRTAQLVRGYSLGTWACCALPVLLRAYYALGDRRTPLRVGCGLVAANLALNLLFVWPLGEAALALSTSACAAVQCLLLWGLLLPKLDRMAYGELFRAMLHASISTAAMCLVADWFMQNLAGNILQVTVTVAVSVTIYALLMWRLLPGGGKIRR